MVSNRPQILLVNPWIYDFSAYDFWIKPVGLLQIGAILQRLGYQVSLIDCLDRHHPLLRSDPRGKYLRDFNDGSGKFYRQEIQKPPILEDVPRKYCRYGIPVDLVEKILRSTPKPDVILLTSAMTYWYPAVAEMAALLRNFFPGVPLILGGCYASLCPDHARTIVKPDYLLHGEGEIEAVRLVAQLTGGAGANFYYDHLDQLPYPAFDLYPALKSVAIMTSRGCPYRCGFCASHLLVANYRRRTPQSVIAEIQYWRDRFDIRHFAFYDDALLHQRDEYAKPMFKALAAEAEKELQFYTPNGLQPRQIDAELASLLKQAGVAQVRLSFESADPKRQKTMSQKVINADVSRAVEHLQNAGFSPNQIGVYVLMGLPDQDFDEVRASVEFIHRLGIKVHLASFSPIPGTDEWRRAIDMGFWSEDSDPLLGNNSIFPIWRKKYSYQACMDFTLWVKQLNQALIKNQT